MCEHLILQSFIIHLIIPNSGWNSSGCCLHRQVMCKTIFYREQMRGTLAK